MVPKTQRYSVQRAPTALQRSTGSLQRYSVQRANHSATALQRYSATALNTVELHVRDPFVCGSFCSVESEEQKVRAGFGQNDEIQHIVQNHFTCEVNGFGRKCSHPRFQRIDIY